MNNADARSPAEATVALLAAVLRGDAPDWPEAVAPGDVLQTAGDEGVDVLVASRAGALTAWPADVRGSLALILRNACVIEAVQERELVAVIESLHAAGVSPIVVKGTALAHTLYDGSYLRSRVDTDLMVAEEQVGRAVETLEKLGYGKAAQNVGTLVSHQIALARSDAHGIWHAFDIHWKVANPHVFANRLTFDDLRKSAVALPRLGTHARSPAPPMAVLLASVHLAAHHSGHPRLIWLYDLHLLCSRLTPVEWDQVVGLATSRRLAVVCASALRMTARRFDTEVPPHVLAALEAIEPAAEDSARYAAGPVGKLATLASDLRALPTVRERARLLYEHAFPPADYMLRLYRRSRRTWLPALYIHRMVTGGWRWLRQS